MRTLLVQASTTTLPPINRLLIDRGHQVACCGVADDALNALVTGSYDLVIVDLILPGIDFEELIRSIRASPQGSWLVILVISASGAPGDIDAALRLGADDYLLRTEAPELLGVRVTTAEQRVEDNAAHLRMMASLSETENHAVVVRMPIVPGHRRRATAERRRMPASVKVARIALIAILGVEFLLVFDALAEMPRNFTPLVGLAVVMAVALLILWGLSVGHRLAWQWGRIIVFLTAMLVTIVAIVAIMAAVGLRAAWPETWGRPDRQPGARSRVPASVRTDAAAAPDLAPYILQGSVSLLEAAGLYTIFFVLGQSSAKRYFELQCPQCGAFTNRSADFLFNRAKCMACRHVW